MQQLVAEDSKAAFEYGRAVREQIPGEAKPGVYAAGASVPFRGLLLPSLRGAEQVIQDNEVPVSVCIRSQEFVADSQVEGEVRAQTVVILKIPGKQPDTAAGSLSRGSQHTAEAAGPTLDQTFDRLEGKRVSLIGGSGPAIGVESFHGPFENIVLKTLHIETYLQGMGAFDIADVVRHLVGVPVLSLKGTGRNPQGGNPGAARAVARCEGNVAGSPRVRKLDLGIGTGQIEERRGGVTDKAGPELVDERAGEQPRFGQRDGLVPRHRTIGPRVNGHPRLGRDSFAIVERVASKIRHLIRPLIVNPAGQVILARHVIKWEAVSSNP